LLLVRAAAQLGPVRAFISAMREPLRAQMLRYLELTRHQPRAALLATLGGRESGQLQAIMQAEFLARLNQGSSAELIRSAAHAQCARANKAQSQNASPSHGT
jgi:hypothetical protein